MKPKFFFLFVALWLSVCGYLFQTIYRDAKENAIAELNARQTIHARQAKLGIEDFFGNLQDLLTKLGSKAHLIDCDAQGRREMDFVREILPASVTALTRVDSAGRILYTTPFSAELAGKDLSGQKHIRRILETRRPVVSDVFTAAQGNRAVALHVPVFDGPDFAGTLGVLIDYRHVSRQFLEAIHIGETGYAWMTSAEGIELYCPVPGHIDRSVFENCKDFPTILSMAEEMIEGREGVCTYVFDRIRDETVEQVKKHAVYLPVRIADTFWSIVVASSEAEMLTTLERFKNQLALIGALLLIGGGYLSFAAMRMWGIVREREARLKAQDSLRRERDYIERIMQTSPAGITRTDADGRVMYANARAEQILGTAISDGVPYAYNDPKWKITDFEGRPFAEERLPFPIVRRTGKPVFDVSHAIEWPDGTRILLSVNAMPLYDDAGRFDGMVAAIEDVTQKVLAEQNYRMLFEQMIDGFALHEILCDDQGRPMDYRFLSVNPAFERLTGLRAESLLGKTVLEALPQTEPYWIEAYGRVALTGEAQLFENYSRELNRYFQVTAFRPAKGRFACMVVDTTQRKQAENELRAAKERFETVFNSHLDALFVLSADKPARILEANHSACRMFGYPPEEMIGQTIEILHVDDAHRQQFQRALFAAVETDGRLSGYE